jgi:TraY domain
VDERLRERLARAAVANERSLGAECRIALKHHLDRDDTEKEEHV